MKDGSRVDLQQDPFGERPHGLVRRRFSVLGARFDFEGNDVRLLRLATHAYASLPAHRLHLPTPRFRVALRLGSQATLGDCAEPPALRLHGANGLLSGAMDASNFAVISPAEHRALVGFSRDMLRWPYHARYELLEFAVYTLAARALEFVSLHAACIASRGRGLLLIGTTGAGKSTISLHSLRRGLELISEDSTFVVPRTLEATGVPTFLHLRESALDWLPAAERRRITRFPVIRRRSGVQKYEIDVRRMRWPMARRPPNLSGVVFLSTRVTPARRPQLLQPLDSAEIRKRLLESQPYAAAQPGWTEFLGRVAKAGAFELRRGEHPDQAVDALAELLR